MQVMTSGAVALQLLSSNSRQPGLQAAPRPTDTIAPAATHYVESTPGLTGVYSDPRLSEAKQEVSQGRRAMDEFGKTLSTDVAVFRAEARSQLEAALGAELDDGKEYWQVSSLALSTVSSDVLDMNRRASDIQLRMSLAMANPNNVNLDQQAVGRSENLDMTSAEDRATAVDGAIEMIVFVRMSGAESLDRDGGFGKELLDKTLGAAGISSKDELRQAYYEQARSEFESGNLTVTYDGFQISNRA